MTSDLETLAEYFRINRLSINSSKSKFMIFGPGAPRCSISLRLGGTTLERVESIRYLGVQLDSTLSWSTHVEGLCSQLASSIGMLYKVHSFLPSSILQLIFNSLIQSKILYAITLYGTASKLLLNRVYVLQKRALKIVHHLPPRYPTLDLFVRKAKRNLPLLALHIYKAQTGRILNNLIFPIVSHEHPTRAAASRKMVVRKARTVRYGDACIQHVGPMIFNSLPLSVIQAPSVASFKHLITDFLRQPDRLASYVEL